MTDPRAEKDRLLDLATRMFGRFGYEAVKLEDLALAGKTDRASINRLCFSKEDLFFQVLRREVDALVEESRRILSTGAKDPDALLRQISGEVFSLVEKRPLIGALMLGRFDQPLANWSERLHELRGRYVEIPQTILLLGREARVVRSDFPVELVAQLCVELHVTSYLYAGAGADAEARRNQRRGVALQIMLRGIKHPSLQDALPVPQTAQAAAAVQLSLGARPAPAVARPLDPSASPRHRLLAAGAQIATQHGLPALTVQAASAAAGVAPLPELNNTERLALAVLEHEVGALSSQVVASGCGSGNALDRLRAMSESAFEAVKEHPLVLALLTGAAAEVVAGQDEALSRLIQRMADVLVPVVEAGMAEGLFRTDLPAPQVARVLFELHMAGHLLFYRPGVDLRLRAMQRRVAALDLLFRGVS